MKDVRRRLMDMDQDGFRSDQYPDEGGTDCNDEDPAVNPSADEIQYDDNDCDPSTPDDDIDGDGYPQGVDCDDTDAEIHPGAQEIWYDDTDQDCDGLSDFDQDLDLVDVDLDCDDTDPEVAPDIEESCDLKDNDCDGRIDEGTDTWWPDRDGDGFGDDESGSTTTCAPDESAVARGGDCDDSDAAANPDQDEICNDELNNNCDGSSGDCGRSGSLALADEPVQILGAEAGDLAGHTLAVGDLTADGWADLVIGAPGLDRSGGSTGGVFLVRRSPRWPGSNSPMRTGCLRGCLVS
jgi:hypothetical protein